MNPINTRIEIAFDAEKFNTDPQRCITYNLTFPGSENCTDMALVSNEVLYNAGKSIQAIFGLLEQELVRRKAPCQLRSRKERRSH